MESILKASGSVLTRRARVARASRRLLFLGFILGLVPGLFLLVLPGLIPSEILHDPHVDTSRYSGWTATPDTFLRAWAYEAAYVTLGEELLFRGLVGGLLMRRLGFAPGNLLQAMVFLLPHLFLLTISTGLWPIVLAQFVAGLLFGRFSFESGSVLPGWIAHSLGNAIGALAFMA